MCFVSQHHRLISTIQVSIGLAVFCIPWLRWKHPEWDRPIKVQLIFPVIYIIATIFITVVPMISTPVETGKISEKTNSFSHSLFPSDGSWPNSHWHTGILHLCCLEEQASLHQETSR